MGPFAWSWICTRQLLCFSAYKRICDWICWGLQMLFCITNYSYFRYIVVIPISQMHTFYYLDTFSTHKSLLLKNKDTLLLISNQVALVIMWKSSVLCLFHIHDLLVVGHVGCFLVLWTLNYMFVYSVRVPMFLVTDIICTHFKVEQSAALSTLVTQSFPIFA